MGRSTERYFVYLAHFWRLQKVGDFKISILHRKLFKNTIPASEKAGFDGLRTVERPFFQFVIPVWHQSFPTNRITATRYIARLSYAVLSFTEFWKIWIFEEIFGKSCFRTSGTLICTMSFLNVLKVSHNVMWHPSRHYGPIYLDIESI